jgi:hypothetical protein
VAHDDLEPFGAERVAFLREDADVLVPNMTIEERFEADEADEGEDIVERVL